MKVLILIKHLLSKESVKKCFGLYGITFSIILSVLFTSPVVFSNEKNGQKGSLANLPAIYIERIKDQSENLVPVLKISYETCVLQKEITQKAYSKKGIEWAAMKDSLSQEYLSNIVKSPHPEPDWKAEKVGINTEKEYFYGDKYALKRSIKKHKIYEKDGLCRLVVDKDYKKQLIDDGTYRYKVYLGKKTSVKRYVSPVKSRIQSDADLKSLLAESSNDSTFSPQPKRIMDKNITKEQVVAGQKCDVVDSKVGGGSICYWQKMHYYTSVMERPVILKKEVQVGSKRGITKAVRFEINKTFNDEIFQPPAGIKVKGVR